MDAQPIAYEVVSDRGREAVYAADLKANAEAACALHGWRLVPIYESVDIVQRLRDRAYSFKAPDALCEEAADEIARLRLTDAEREAVEMAYSRLTAEAKYTAVAATLRGLLERHGPTGSE